MTSDPLTPTKLAQVEQSPLDPLQYYLTEQRGVTYPIREPSLSPTVNTQDRILAEHRQSQNHLDSYIMPEDTIFSGSPPLRPRLLPAKGPLVDKTAQVVNRAKDRGVKASRGKGEHTSRDERSPQDPDVIDRLEVRKQARRSKALIVQDRSRPTSARLRARGKTTVDEQNADSPLAKDSPRKPTSRKVSSKVVAATLAMDSYKPLAQLRRGKLTTTSHPDRRGLFRKGAASIPVNIGRSFSFSERDFLQLHLDDHPHRQRDNVDSTISCEDSEAEARNRRHEARRSALPSGGTKKQDYGKRRKRGLAKPSAPKVLSSNGSIEFSKDACSSDTDSDDMHSEYSLQQRERQRNAQERSASSRVQPNVNRSARQVRPHNDAGASPRTTQTHCHRERSLSGASQLSAWRGPAWHLRDQLVRPEDSVSQQGAAELSRRVLNGVEGEKARSMLSPFSDDDRSRARGELLPSIEEVLPESRKARPLFDPIDLANGWRLPHQRSAASKVASMQSLPQSTAHKADTANLVTDQGAFTAQLPSESHDPIPDAFFAPAGPCPLTTLGRQNEGQNLMSPLAAAPTDLAGEALWESSKRSASGPMPLLATKETQGLVTETLDAVEASLDQEGNEGLGPQPDMMPRWATPPLLRVSNASRQGVPAQQQTSERRRWFSAREHTPLSALGPSSSPARQIEVASDEPVHWRGQESSSPLKAKSNEAAPVLGSNLLGLYNPSLNALSLGESRAFPERTSSWQTTSTFGPLSIHTSVSGPVIGCAVKQSEATIAQSRSNTYATTMTEGTTQTCSSFDDLDFLSVRPGPAWRSQKGVVQGSFSPLRIAAGQIEAAQGARTTWGVGIEEDEVSLDPLDMDWVG